METPETGAWLDYTIMELGNWVHLFAKRAQLRGYTQPEKRAEDLHKARNYWRMIGSRLDAMERGSTRAIAKPDPKLPPNPTSDPITSS